MSNPIVKDRYTVHGTTTVGLVTRDGVVLATDTRAIAGGYFIAHKRVRKVLKIDEHIGMTIAGAVADAQNVVDIIRFNVNLHKIQKRRPMPVRSAAQLASTVFFSSRLFPYIADVLLGGWDEEGPTVYNIDLFGSLSKANYVSTGSGSPVAYGILESEYNEGLSLKSAQELAARAIIAAIRRNAGTGDGFDVVYITKDGYFDVGEDEKNRISKQLFGRS